jgi:hypothetical protein
MAKRKQFLSEDRQRELVCMIAARRPPLEIVEHFLSEYDHVLSYQQIWKYKNSKKWADFLKEEREKFDNDFSKCLMASKRNRLMFLHKAYKIAKAEKDAKGMTMAISQAQKEMEVHKIALTDKAGEDFKFVINIGPPPEEQKPKQVGPVLTLISPSKDDDEVD